MMVNRKQFCNVLFSDVILPLLVTCGSTADKDLLTDGVKMDKLPLQKIAADYNDPKKYNDDVHCSKIGKGEAWNKNPSFLWAFGMEETERGIWTIFKRV